MAGNTGGVTGFPPAANRKYAKPPKSAPMTTTTIVRPDIPEINDAYFRWTLLEGLWFHAGSSSNR
jgi:hypothetical protein